MKTKKNAEGKAKDKKDGRRNPSIKPVRPLCGDPGCDGAGMMPDSCWERLRRMKDDGSVEQEWMKPVRQGRGRRIQAKKPPPPDRTVEN